ncbi:MAG: lectin-like protein [Pirellulaceae bacterium]
MIQSLLASDSNLVYSAETNKFYRYVGTTGNWSDASTAAQADLLAGIAGELVTIHSATENQIVHDFSQLHGGSIWLGASDDVVEGEWYWYSAGNQGQQFWEGNASGYAVNGAYENWLSNEPNNDTGTEPTGENHLYMA